MWLLLVLDDAVCVGRPDNNLSVRHALLSLLLHSGVVLLLDIVLVAIEELLDGVAAEQEEAFLGRLFCLWHLVDVCVCQRWSRF